MLGQNRHAQVLNDFLEERAEKIKKVDIDIFADDFVQDSYQKALLNVTKLWLLSRKYDRPYQPNWAGFFDDRLRSYTMNDDGAAKVVTDLKAAIANKIPDVFITEATAEPRPNERGWEVSVSAIDTDTDISTAVGANKENFVLVTENENITDIKVYNTKTQAWEVPAKAL